MIEQCATDTLAAKLRRHMEVLELDAPVPLPKLCSTEADQIGDRNRRNAKLPGRAGRQGIRDPVDTICETEKDAQPGGQRSQRSSSS